MSPLPHLFPGLSCWVFALLSYPMIHSGEVIWPRLVSRSLLLLAAALPCLVSTKDLAATLPCPVNTKDLAVLPAHRLSP